MAAGTLSWQANFLAQRAGLTGRSLQRLVLQSPLLRWRYSGAPVEQLLLVPQDLRTADPSFASEIYHGQFGLAGSVAAMGTESPFAIHPPNQIWARELHGFAWLRHLNAAEDQISREHARALLRDWVEMNRKIRGLPWEPEIAARRTISWLSHTPMVLEAADGDFYDLMMTSLARHIRYLRATYHDTPDGAPRLLTLTALLLSGLCALDQDQDIETYIEVFSEELERQILSDGGHFSRNPGQLTELLFDLLPLRQCFVARDRPPPPALIGAIDRMMPMLRFFRMGDGELARFHGMGATTTDELATVLAYDDVQGTPVDYAKPSGYVRAMRGRLLLIGDFGPPPAFSVSRGAHAGCLSFELSSGDDPIIVNCGAPIPTDEDWVLSARSTAAHSTMVVCDTSSSQILPSISDDSPALARLSGPASVLCELIEEGEEIEIHGSHDGYLSRFGIIHERSLRLSASGNRLRGEDRLIAPHGLRGEAQQRRGDFAIRFHLHPAIRAQLSQDGRTALLVTPRREGWRLATNGPSLAIEESVFLADIKGPRRGLQVVISGIFDQGGELRVGWLLEKSAATVSADPSSLEGPAEAAGELPLE